MRGAGARSGWCWQGGSRQKGWINSASSLRNISAGDTYRSLRGHNRPPGLSVLPPSDHFCSSDLQPVCLCSTFVHNHPGQFPFWVVDYLPPWDGVSNREGKTFPESTPRQGWQEVHNHSWVCPGLPPALRQQCCGRAAGGLGTVKALVSVVCAGITCWRIQVWSEGGSILPENGRGKKQWEEETLRGLLLHPPAAVFRPGL